MKNYLALVWLIFLDQKTTLLARAFPKIVSWFLFMNPKVVHFLDFCDKHFSSMSGFF